MSLHQYWLKLTENRFVRSVSLLVGGTALAQAVMVLVLPLLTRLYSPEDFSVLAVYSAVVMLFTPAACLRLDVAIPMPERDEDGASLLALALMLATTTTALLALVVFIAPDEVTKLLAKPQLRPYLWLLPIGVFLAASFSALQFWCSRRTAFSTVARARITQALAGAATMAGLGWLSYGPVGLLLGQIINGGAGVLALCRRVMSIDRQAFKDCSIAEMRHLFKRYERFPRLSTLEALANSAAIQLPILMIATMVPGAEVGFLALAMRVAQVPMVLVGSAVSQVYVCRAPEEYRAGTLGPFTANVLGGLLKTGVGPLLFFGIVAPDVFSVIFGGPWQRAGVLVGWMTPWFIAQFLASPVSLALHVTDNQRMALLLQIAGLVFRVAFVWLAAATLGVVSEAYAISGALFYALYLVLLLAVVSPRISDLWQQVRKASPYLFAWCLAGVLCLTFLRAIMPGTP